MEVRHITSTTARFVGISEDEIMHVFKQFWYSTSPDVSKPGTIVDYYDIDTLYANLINLQPNTTYYVRIVADNGMDSIYSEAAMFTTKKALVFVDSRDNRQYEYVQIGKQSWMAENLDFAAPGSVYYDNDSLGYAEYGRLYIWETARKVCPEGWHLPADQEWKTMEMELGMEQGTANARLYRGTNQGDKLKEIGRVHWSARGSSTNSTGFRAYGGGHHDSSFEFSNFRSVGNFWTSTDTIDEYTDDIAIMRALNNDDSKIYRYLRPQSHGLSVRCVKD